MAMVGRVVVTKQAEFDAAVARGDAVEVRAGRFTAHGNAVVWASDHAEVSASGNAVVSAHDHAVVSARGNAEVWAHDNARVWAHDNARVYAFDNAVVRRALPIDPEWRKMYERELERASCAV